MLEQLLLTVDQKHFCLTLNFMKLKFNGQANQIRRARRVCPQIVVVLYSECLAFVLGMLLPKLLLLPANAAALPCCLLSSIFQITELSLRCLGKTKEKRLPTLTGQGYSCHNQWVNLEQERPSAFFAINRRRVVVHSQYWCCWQRQHLVGYNSNHASNCRHASSRACSWIYG